MNPDETLRKYLRFPETVMLSTVLTKHQVYTYDTDEEVTFHWDMQFAIFGWLAYEIDMDFDVWDTIRKTVGKKDPTKWYSR